MTCLNALLIELLFKLLCFLCFCSVNFIASIDIAYAYQFFEFFIAFYGKF